VGGLQRAGEDLAIPVSTLRGKVLLAGTDPDRSGRLAAALAAHGLAPSLAFGRSQIIESLDHDHFDLVVLDLKSAPALRPDATNADGELTAIADRSRAMVVALGGPDSLALDLLTRGVHALPANGDVDETATALRTLIDRRPADFVDPTLRWGPLRLDQRRRTATWNAQALPLTRLQFRLLAALVEAEGGVLTRAELHQALYDVEPVDDGERVVAHVRRIRQKVESDPSEPEFLLTVRGEGFRLADLF
jgi:two-component system response regulator RegX3